MMIPIRMMQRSHDGAMADDGPTFAHKPRRRTFTAEYDLAIVEAYDACYDEIEPLAGTAGAWGWGTTALRGPDKGVWFDLYVAIDKSCSNHRVDWNHHDD